MNGSGAAVDFFPSTQPILYFMKLLDLFCGAGGAAMGYHQAGFEVFGIDIEPQPHYPFRFKQGDVMKVKSISDFDVIHASPPCPRYSSMTHVSGERDNHPDLIGPVRELLEASGKPYIIENVVGAPLRDPLRLCGSSFGLGALCRDGIRRQLRRHRLFESNVYLFGQPCIHQGEPIGVYGHGGGQRKTVWNGGVNRGYMGTLAECSEAMDIDWMLKREISQAIPPAYTAFLGAQLAAFLHKSVDSSPQAESDSMQGFI